MILLMMVDTPEEKRKFVILYENYRYLMLKVAVDILHDYQLAEDAVQEAFVRVAKHMENVGQPEETATKRYLIMITKHAAIDLYRRRNRLQSREIYMDELPEETGQLTYMAPEEEHGVLDILKNLPPKYRDIFLLKYSAHLENREIARICGLREGTIRQRIARGKRLYEKMPIVDAAMVRQLEVCTQKDYVFSDKFRKRMKRLIQKEKYMYAEKQLKKITQKIAAAAVVMLVGALTVTMSVEAYRVRFFHTIKMVLDGNISIYSYESDEEKISDTILKPQYIPDNYRLNEEKITDTTSVLEYGNDKKHLIFQQTIVTNEKMIFDTNYNSVEQIRINGMTVFLYRYTDETFWAYGEYGNSVYVLAGDTIQKEEIEKIYKHWIW